MNYSEVEAKVREATNDDTWGPHGSLMNEIAKYTFTYESYPEVMAMLWKRMLETKKNWRRTYKVIVLILCVILVQLIAVTIVAVISDTKWVREGCH